MEPDSRPEPDPRTPLEAVRLTLESQTSPANQPTNLGQALAGKAEAALWVAGASTLAQYGNGSLSTYQIWLGHPRVHRGALLFSLCMAALNIAIFLYVQLVLRLARRVRGFPELHHSWPIPCGSLCAVAAVLAYTYACWGVWRWFTLPVVGLEVFGLVMAVNLLPPVARYKAHQS